MNGDVYSYIRLPRALSSFALKDSRDGALTTPLGNLFQCLHLPHDPSQVVTLTHDLGELVVSTSNQQDAKKNISKTYTGPVPAFVRSATKQTWPFKEHGHLWSWVWLWMIGFARQNSKQRGNFFCSAPGILTCSESSRLQAQAKSFWQQEENPCYQAAFLHLSITVQHKKAQVYLFFLFRVGCL